MVQVEVVGGVGVDLDVGAVGEALFDHDGDLAGGFSVGYGFA